jgi:hypothetical protein
MRASSWFAEAAIWTKSKRLARKNVPTYPVLYPNIFLNKIAPFELLRTVTLADLSEFAGLEDSLSVN